VVSIGLDKDTVGAVGTTLILIAMNISLLTSYSSTSSSLDETMKPVESS
jgi:hypothetical protein